MMKIKMKTMAVIIAVIIFGGIAATMAANIWTTTTNKVPIKYKTGESAGEYNPLDIRGSYSFQDVSTLFEIDLQVLYSAFGIDPGTDGTLIKTRDLEVMYEDLEVDIGNESVQVFVALYKALPVDLDGTYLPKHAVDILLENDPKLPADQKEYLQSHQITLSGAVNNVNPTEKITELESSIKGNTTFQQILDLGIKKEQIEVVIGGSIPPTNKTVKDHCLSNGLSFSEVKTALTELIP